MSEPDFHRLPWLRSMRGSGKTVELSTTGISMEPLIREDSVATIRFSAVEDLMPGDIILFERGERLILHRILWRVKGEGAFVEKGDHQAGYGRVEAGQVLGRLESVIREGETFRPDSGWGVWITKLLLGWGRFEWGLVRIKVALFGTGETKLGRWIMAAMRRGKRWVRPRQG